MYLLWGVVAPWMERRFKTWAGSFTPHCLCLSDETLQSPWSLLPGVYGMLGKVKYPIQGMLLSFAFHDLKFCLSSQLKAASCALCSSEMPPSKQVNGHSFTICLIVWCPPQSQSGEAM